MYIIVIQIIFDYFTYNRTYSIILLIIEIYRLLDYFTYNRNISIVKNNGDISIMPITSSNVNAP